MRGSRHARDRPPASEPPRAARRLRADSGRSTVAPPTTLCRCLCADSGRPPVAPPTAICRRIRAESGQSTIEILGALPLLVVVVLAAAELLAAGAARISASSAAEAAAMALLQGGDPSAAARSAAPGWTHPRITVRTRDRHVRVRLAPPTLLPGLADLLATTAEADAGAAGPLPTDPPA